MEDRGVGSWIERRARVAPERTALVHGGTRRSYGSFAERIGRLASAWRDLGVERGDRVVWRGPNHPAFLESLFAAAKLGAVLAPVNHRLDDAVASELVVRYSPALVVEHAVAPLEVAGSRPERVRVGPGDGGIDLEELAGSGPVRTIDEAVGPEELCLLPHTSGTTGAPRGVMLTHANVTANVVNMLSVADVRADDVTVAVAPFFRTGGTGVNVLPVLFKGGAVVVPDTTAADDMLALIERERITIGFGNPDLLAALTASPRWPTADLSSVRWFVTGGAPVPERLVRTYQGRDVTFLQGYGLSEAAPVVLLLDADRALDKPGSAGTPPLFVDVRVVGPDGSTCRQGETGELQVRGPNVMAGYWQDEDATRRALGDDGWLRTGDAARTDPDGYIWIVDRMGDAFEVDGQLVFPGEVERVLLDRVEVRDAGVSAQGAFVVLDVGAAIGPDDLLATCRAHLRPFQVPSRVVVVDALPRSSVGKLLRHELGHPPAGAS